MRGPQLVGIAVADEPQRWADVGFDVEAGRVVIGNLTIALGQPVDRPGWWFDPALDGSVHGIASVDALKVQQTAAEHSNGAVAVDHVVVTSPNVATTTVEFEERGFSLRKTRQVGSNEQRFFWAGDTIIELVGPAVATDPGPAEIWGIALVSDDLDESKRQLGDRLSDPRDAVQPGRRIAAIRTKEYDISITIALMSPHRG